MALLVGRFVPLGLTVLAPIMINIVAFHAFVAHDSLLMSLFLSALGVYLAWAHRGAFPDLLAAKSQPAGQGGSVEPGASKPIAAQN